VATDKLATANSNWKAKLQNLGMRFGAVRISGDRAGPSWSGNQCGAASSAVDAPERNNFGRGVVVVVVALFKADRFGSF
jgi:hypothetical protein